MAADAPYVKLTTTDSHGDTIQYEIPNIPKLLAGQNLRGDSIILAAIAIHMEAQTRLMCHIQSTLADIQAMTRDR